jgi:putative endonuclease
MSVNQELRARVKDAAAGYLERIGVAVSERDYSCPSGRVDIIGWDGNVLVLVDVKTRDCRSVGATDETVSAVRRRRLAGVAAAYAQGAGIVPASVRYDVISIKVLGENRALLRHWRDAAAEAV